jgi:hypothetical protein
VPWRAYGKTLARFLTNEWHLNAVCELFQEIAEGHEPTPPLGAKLTGGR